MVVRRSRWTSCQVASKRLLSCCVAFVSCVLTMLSMAVERSWGSGPPPGGRGSCECAPAGAGTGRDSLGCRGMESPALPEAAAGCGAAGAA
eukprot:1105886-Pyramimonas_sp.AAC.1